MLKVVNLNVLRSAVGRSCPFKLVDLGPNFSSQVPDVIVEWPVKDASPELITARTTNMII
jgi:hypothetical protein